LHLRRLAWAAQVNRAQRVKPRHLQEWILAGLFARQRTGANRWPPRNPDEVGGSLLYRSEAAEYRHQRRVI